VTEFLAIHSQAALLTAFVAVTAACSSTSRPSDAGSLRDAGADAEAPREDGGLDAGEPEPIPVAFFRVEDLRSPECGFESTNCEVRVRFEPPELMCVFEGPAAQASYRCGDTTCAGVLRLYQTEDPSQVLAGSGGGCDYPSDCDEVAGSGASIQAWFDRETLQEGLGCALPEF